MATSLSYGEAKNLTPQRIKTPDWIKIKFSTVDYVDEGTHHAKFYANPSNFMQIPAIYRGFTVNG